MNKKNTKRNPWTPEEDARLTQIVNKFGGPQWTEISKEMGTRNSKQCRDRWTNHLALAGEIATNWTEEEDIQILKLYQEIGKKWAKIASYMPGRAENHVKNRWHKSIKKRMEQLPDGSWGLGPKRKRGRTCMNYVPTQDQHVRYGVKGMDKNNEIKNDKKTDHFQIPQQQIIQQHLPPPIPKQIVPPIMQQQTVSQVQIQIPPPPPTYDEPNILSIPEQDHIFSLNYNSTDGNISSLMFSIPSFGDASIAMPPLIQKPQPATTTSHAVRLMKPAYS